MTLLERARRLLPKRSEEEDVHDFLGVVEVDLDPRLGVLVLPDHVAAVLRVSGTSFAYASAEQRTSIIEAWQNLLNNARLSLQIFIDRRPYNWELPGNLLDQMRHQMEDSDPSDWQRRRLQRWSESMSNREFERMFPVTDLRQYLIISYAIGEAEWVRLPNEPPIHVPPNKGWRFWEKVPTAFGDRRHGLDTWRRKRNEAIRGLHLEIGRLENDTRSIPGLRLERASGLEVVQLLHLLWRSDSAYDEWIGDEARLNHLRQGDALDAALQQQQPETTSEEGLVA